VLAIEASRLARNGRDWHTLIEFCGLVGTIIVDEDGIYDPRHPNDRLHTWLRDEAIELPVKSRSGETRGIIWRLPAYNTVHNILTNPIYAGPTPSGARRAGSASRMAASACGAVCIAQWPNGMF
jgi:hypothetical protein